MTKRIALTPEAVTSTLYSRLQKIKSPTNQALIVEIFKNLNSRRKCYRLGSFKKFKPHATEYAFDGFFKSITIAGRTRLIPIEEPEQIHFVKAIVALSNKLGFNRTYEKVLDTLELAVSTNLANEDIIEIIPEMLFAYTTNNKPETLVLKLEYFFGADVIDILVVNGFEPNTGKERMHKERAIEHAKLNLAGKPPRLSRRKTEATP